MATHDSKSDFPLVDFYNKQRLSLVNLNCSAVSANYLNILLPNKLLSITLVEITLVAQLKNTTTELRHTPNADYVKYIYII